MPTDAEGKLRQLEERGARLNPFGRSRALAMGCNGMVATSHPYATVAGLDVLRAGGRAMDAAIAAAAVLGVVEPMSTGLGGDAFLLYYEAESKRVRGLNGSGRSPGRLARQYFRDRRTTVIDPFSWEAVTVPGAVDCWAVALERFGARSFTELLAPAIEYAEKGFPVTETVALRWAQYEESLKKDRWARETYLVDGKAPTPGYIFKNPNLAKSLRELAAGGRDVFYRGALAKEICRHAQETGGSLQVDDFRSHNSEWVEPISADYRGYHVLQCPPNGQGIAVLMMLNMLSGMHISKLRHNAPEYLHLLIEAKKLAYADLYRYVADGEKFGSPVPALLSRKYASERLKLIDPAKAAAGVNPGSLSHRDTVYVAAVDSEGNAASFINSLFDAFGSRIVGGQTGILLQNRGVGFTLEESHPNEYAPLKRPFHTIIPGMVLRDGYLYMVYGCVGGAMQPQGQLQFLLNHLDFGMTIQQAIDAPRFRHLEGPHLRLEHGFPHSTLDVLRQMGHNVEYEVSTEFGGAQAIAVPPQLGTIFGASDPRKDGCALGY